MYMKKILLTFLFLPLFLQAQLQKDSIQFKKISDEILVNSYAYESLKELTKGIGNRLSGSDNYTLAVAWAEKKLIEAGAEKVWLQEVKVPVWVRGKENLHIKIGNKSWQTVNFLSLGNSQGTNGKDVEAEVLMVNSLEEFEKLSPNQVKDKAVFFNYKFRQEFVETMDGYGDAAKYRVITASKVASKGGKFVVIRSLSTGLEDVPHTGTLRYDENYPKIPAIAIGNSTADEWERMLGKEKIRLKLNSNCSMNEDVINHTVIGEMKGKKDDKVIVVGAHLDSWDVGEGAHDDGAGVVQSIEVLRTFKELKIQNQHTIRVVLYANEENGARGGVKYAEIAKEKNENHLFALESDAGGFSPRGFGLKMEESKRKQIQSWSPLFLPYGIYDFQKVSGGVDVDTLYRLLNVPVSGLIPDSQRYFDIHHTPADTFEKVNKRELLLGAVAMTQLIYLIDQNW
jgi:carboxypeptidase Q